MVVSGWSSSFTVWCSRHTTRVLSHTTARTRRWLRRSWSGLLLVGGAFACARGAHLVQWQSAGAIVARLGAPLLVLLLLPAVSLLIKSLGWRSLLPAPLRPSVGRTFSTFVAAQGVNELGFSLLGEPLKVLVLPQRARAVGVAVVATDNVVAFAALISVLVTFALCPHPAALLSWGLVGFAAFVLGQASARVPRYLAGFSAHYVGKLWLSLEIGLGLYFLGEPALTTAAPLSLSWSTATTLGAAVPGQLGVVEAALLHSGAALGIATPSLLALAIIRRVRSLLWMGVGLLLAARFSNSATNEVTDASTAPAE